MKKVKTIITSLIIIFATAILSACSCSGDGGNTPDVTPVACQSIAISSDFAGAVKNDETGYLKIICQLSDEFAITYKLSPESTTQTQVDWSFSENNVVGCKNRYDYTDGVYSFSRGTEQTIKFVANRAGSTTIRFSVHGTDKFVLADITVTTPKATWPTFLAPTGIDYDAKEGMIKWNPVTKYQKPSGEIVDAPSVSGQVTELGGYMVSWTNLTTGEKGGTDQPIFECKYGDETIFTRGETYAVSVVAKGNSLSVSDSASSDVLRFHQLATVQDVKNDNGIITFTSPNYSEHNYVYYEEGNNSRFVDSVSNGSEVCAFNYKDTFLRGNKDLYKYKVYVVSYPKDYFNTNIRESSKNYVVSAGVRYYQSVPSNEIDIQRLYTPSISFDHTMANSDFILEGVTFGLGVTADQPHLSSKISIKTNESNYEGLSPVGFKYQIFKNGNKVYPNGQEYATDPEFDTSKLRENNNTYTGLYTLKVFAYGSSSETIESEVREFSFRMLGDKHTSGIKADNRTLSVSLRDGDDGTANIRGVDFYFLKKNDNGVGYSGDYKFAFVDKNPDGNTTRGAEIDLVNLSLAPGSYDVYARFVGICLGSTNSINNSATSAVFNVLENMTVANTVNSSDLLLSSAGLLKFTNVYDNANYKISITQGLDSEEITLSTTAQKSTTVEFDLSSYLNKLAGGSSASITIVCNGFRDENGADHTYVESQPVTVKFSRLKTPKNIALSDYTLSFKETVTGANYEVTLDGVDGKLDITGNGSTVEIDLNANGIKQESFASIIAGKVAKVVTEFKFSVQATGSASSVGTVGSLNSEIAENTFVCSSTPDDVEINGNNLSWTLTEGGSQSFDIILTYAGQTKPETISCNSVIGTLDEATNKYTYVYEGIDTKLKGDSLKDKVVKISVLHKVSDKFYGKASDPISAIALGDLTINKVKDGGNPAIQFVALSSTANIKYIITINDDDANQIEIEGLGMGATCTKTLASLLSDMDTAGTYSIKVKATLTGGDGINSPYGFDSAESEITIQIISKAISVSVSGDNVTFVSIDDKAEYTLQYRLKFGTEWTAWKEINQELSGALGTTISYDLSQVQDIKDSDGGEIGIRVVSTIEYTETGILLCGEILDKSIIKLGKTTLSSDNDGMISYSLGSDLDTYQIILYLDGNRMSSNEYSVDYDNKKITILKYTDKTSYSARLVSNGYLASNMSDQKQFTMVTTPDALEKIGEWVIWTMDANATSYTILVSSGSDSAYEIEISDVVTDGDAVTSATVKVKKTQGENTVNDVDTTIAKFDNGKLMYNFVALCGGTITAGDYQIRIKPNTTKQDYLSGITSSLITVTKLSNEVTINANGSFELSGYKSGSREPLSMYYEIHKNISEYLQKSEDTFKFEAKAQYYTITFQSVDSENNYSIVGTPIQIMYDSAESKALIYDTTENKYVLNDGVKVVDESGVNYIQITLTNIITAENERNSVARAILEYETIIDESASVVEYTSEFKGQIESSDKPYLIALNKGILDDGNYSIKIRFIGNGNDIVDSDDKMSDNSYARLQAIIVGTSDGEIVWSAEDGATYVIQINGVNMGSSTTDPNPTEPDPSEPDGEETEAENISTQSNTQNELTFTLKYGETKLTEDMVKDKNNGVGFATDTEYKIKIMGYKNGSLASVWSDEFTFKKLIAPTNLKVKASISDGSYTYIDPDGNEKPASISVGDAILAWDDINNTWDEQTKTGEKLNYLYNMYIGENSGNDILIYNSKNGTLVGQLLPKDCAKETYNIKMKVQGNSTYGTTGSKIGLLTSDYSKPIQVEYVTETTKVEFKNGNFEWNAVKGAYAYKLTFEQNSKTVYTTYTKTTSYSFTNSEFAGYGYYTVKISAITSPSTAIVSTAESTEVNNTMTIFRSPSVEQVFVKDGQVAWSIAKSALETMLGNDKINETLTSALNEISSLTGSSVQDKAISYLGLKINTQGQGNENVDNILYPFLNARLSLNGAEKLVTATGFEVDSDNLIFTYNMSTMPTVAKPTAGGNAQEGETGDATTTGKAETYMPGKYVIKVAPVGKANETLASVDGKYSCTFEAFKPQTPFTNISNDEKANKMNEGNILWTLVPTAERTIPANENENSQIIYHQNYQLIAQNGEKLISANINTTDGDVGEVKETTYSGNLKTIFASNLGKEIERNTNYTMNLRVIGTADSRKLASENISYLNSDIYNYGDEYMNILGNLSLEVVGNEIKWTPSEGASSSTKLYIYGPFACAPDRNDFDAGEEGAESYKQALYNWKVSISNVWMSIFDPNSADHEENKDLKRVIEFEVPNPTEEGATQIDLQRQTTYTLSGDPEYGAGSYIIRKQEIGNGKGIIDTEFYTSNDTGYTYDRLFIKESDPLEEENMGVIATKLGQTSAGIDTDVWASGGKFIWKPVERANAYRIHLIGYGDLSNNFTEIKESDYSILVSASETLNSSGYHEWDIPDILDPQGGIAYNNADFKYSIRIIATHVDNLNETNYSSTTSSNYFDGEQVESDKYFRTDRPLTLKVVYEDDVTYLQWNDGNTIDTKIISYQIKTSHDNKLTTIVTDNNVCKYVVSGDNGVFDAAGEYMVTVRALGKSDGGRYLNSTFSDQIIIIKLPTPELSVQNGIFEWGTASNELTNNQQASTKLKVEYTYNGQQNTIDHGFGEGTELLGVDVLNYPLFTELKEQGYDYDYDLNQELPAVDYKFYVRYAPKEISNSSPYYIASPTETYNVNKLSAPEISVSKVSGDTTNRVEWTWDNNATSYRALVLVKNSEKIFDEMSDDTNFFSKITNTDDNTTKGYLNISAVLADLGINLAGGAQLKVYIQAIGTTNSKQFKNGEQIYINSSFSACSNITIPSQPSASSFDSATGTFKWTLSEDQINANHNVQLTIGYTVDNVDSLALNSYWIPSANYSKNNNTAVESTNDSAKDNRAYSEIVDRKIRYSVTTNGTYTINVVDVVFLNANGKTPTSYQVTNIGTKYTFAINIMVGNTEEESGELISGTYVHSDANGIQLEEAFGAFGYGDGSSKYRYGVSTETQLNSIRYFVDRHFEITTNITLTTDPNNLSSWKMIEDTFTGSIVGKLITTTNTDGTTTTSYPTISNLTPIYTINGGNTYAGFMMTNKGTISDLNFEVKYNSLVSDGASYYYATIAITNDGTINNVHITNDSTGGIAVEFTGTNSDSAMYVSGMVYTNNGTISNSSVEVGENNSSALSEIRGIYALRAGTPVSRASGIVGINYGTIANTHFDGDITANYVSGIADTSYGTIDRCYSSGNAYVIGSTYNDDTANPKSITFGGIVGTLATDNEKQTTQTTITNSYSIMTINPTNYNVDNAKIGGLYANIANDTYAIISNCYTAVKFNTSATFKDAYYFGVESSNIEYSNNYYLVIKKETVNGTNVTYGDMKGQSNGLSNATECTALDALKNALAGLVDQDNQAIYDTTVEGYPVLKQKSN